MNARQQRRWFFGTSHGLFLVLAGWVGLALMPLALAQETPPPMSVTVAGSLQSEVGCSGDWQPDCALTHLEFDSGDDVWQGTFNLPAGGYEYKAALNDGWAENYGVNAQRNGANIPLNLGDAAGVKFYYDHKTHWITSNRNNVIAVAPGNFQKLLGCPGDWDPGCLRSWLEDPDGDGIYSFTTQSLPAGNYEVKVAHGESWSENYGAGGVANGPNIPFAVPADCTTMLFSYDPATHILTVAAVTLPDPQPANVTIAGNLQSELGCSGDWQPDCAATHLDFDAWDAVWQKTFDVPAGSWEYKAALNDSWAENYGANATPGGANIGLTLDPAAPVKFYYSHQTHWVTSNRNAVIATAPGSYQHFLGCPGDWDPGCLRSWLQDTDGDGVYTFKTRKLPAGNYEVKAAIDESWNENYGANGERNGPNIAFTVPAACTEMYFRYEGATHILTVSAEGAPRGNLQLARGQWLTRDTLAWNVGAMPAGTTFALHAAPEGGLKLERTGVTGGETFALTLDPAGLPDALKEKFPHLASFKAFLLGNENRLKVPDLLKGQLAISAVGPDGLLLDANSIQIAGVLDNLFANDAALGPTWKDGVPTLRVWAPTARSVKLLLFADSQPETTPTAIDMLRDDTTGNWSVKGTADWKNQFYIFDVEVFVRTTGKVEHNLVTDPYSLSLAANSTRSQLIDLADKALLPPGWKHLKKPALDAFEDIVLYELHVRDFSASDPSVPENLKGTFPAFTLAGSRGGRHLSALAKAGVTHVHLLPSFDIATVNEDRSAWQQPEGDLSTFPPDSTEQQARVLAVADKDGFNWGYDPWHYTVPEGSYATQPDGSARILEFRSLVAALNKMGLRVVMDVVYNHTTAAGQDTRSVLDRVVPGYYHRLDLDGNITTSSCCQNTASENAMMEKLLIDSVLTWVKDYKVDGFRFDLMGHHMKANMLKLRAALDQLDPKKDGVEGRQVYVYGEGWNFGEVANNARGVNATQLNMAGTGIGSFNDRLRDGARGGGPFDPPRHQGFLTGLFLDPNGTPQGTPEEQKATLLHRTDWIRSGLAGNLASYRFIDAAGRDVSAAEIDYNGQPTGYTQDPQEDINYISAHDNETLFDAVQLKAAGADSISDRVRMHNLGISLIALGQGIPFFHAGDEILRSKSLDRNSYNSGDWFNKLDFTYSSNNWGVGLPPARDNQGNWPIMQPLLADPALAVAKPEIQAGFSHFVEMLAIRRTSGLFRLRTAGEIESRLKMYNTGVEQIPGLIVFSLFEPETGGPAEKRSIRGGGRAFPDYRINPLRFPNYQQLVVLVNAAPTSVTWGDAELAGLSLRLHPVLAGSTDPLSRLSTYDSATGSFTVPGRTTAVFVCCNGPKSVVLRPSNEQRRRP